MSVRTFWSVYIAIFTNNFTIFQDHDFKRHQESVNVLVEKKVTPYLESMYDDSLYQYKTGLQWTIRV